jgi:DNA-binding FrmR family transcriptional regulator
MEKTSKQKISNRMSYIRGHLDGVRKMIKDDKYCIDIILQNEAVIGALKKVNQIILENHLNSCVARATRGRDEKERSRKLGELSKLFKKINK